jgi:hypothetical protein
MFCKVFWPTRRPQKSLFVPIAAVVTTPLEQFVCKVNQSNRIEWVTVRKGQIMDGMVEIFGNIQEGDLVAERGTEELVNQELIKPVGYKITR